MSCVPKSEIKNNCIFFQKAQERKYNKSFINVIYKGKS